VTTSEGPSAEAAPAKPQERWLAPGTPWRSRLRIAVEIGLFVGAYAAIVSYQERHLLRKDAPAPSFTLASLDGREVSLDSLQGKRILLHFWATWCGVCRQEFGALNAVERGLGPDEALVTIVADSEDAGRIRDFVAKEHIAYPVLLGTDSVVRAFHVGAFPTNYFLDKGGRIAGHTVGMSTRVSLAARLALAR
jgi:peroxiredoxin